MTNVKAVNIQYLSSADEDDVQKPVRVGDTLWNGFTHVFGVFGKPIPGSGKYRYVTGLETDPSMSDEKKSEIEAARADLERQYGKDTLNPFNEEFWKDIKITIKRKNMFLDIETNPEHKLLYYVIKAGGISEIASSYEDAINRAIPTKWFMIEPNHLSELVTREDKAMTKAIVYLDELDEDRGFMDMFLVHKVLITSDRGATKETPKSALWKDLHDFIHGKLVKTDKRQTPKQFVETFKMLNSDKGKLFVTAYVKEASYFNYITTSEDNQLMNIQTKTKYGATLDNAVAYLMNPANQFELENIKERVEKKWSE